MLRKLIFQTPGADSDQIFQDVYKRQSHISVIMGFPVISALCRHASAG